MAKLIPENEYSLENMQGLLALSMADISYLRNFCPNPDEVIQHHCTEASKVTNDHASHLMEWERRLADHCFEEINKSPRVLDCCMQEVCHSKLLIARVSGLEDEEYFLRAPYIGKSLNRSFEVFTSAPQHKILRILNKWHNKRKQKDEETRKRIERLKTKENELFGGFFGNEQKTDKSQRNAFLRSCNIAQMIMGKPAVDNFIQNKESRIQGVLYNYIVKMKSKSLLSTGGHGQTVLTVCTLDGNEICDLCIYSKDCTLLDHVVGIFTRVKAGEELEILQTGNVLNIREGYKREANGITALKGKGVVRDDAFDDAARDRLMNQINRSILNMDEVLKKMDQSIAAKRKMRKSHLRHFLKNHFTARNITAITK